MRDAKRELARLGLPPKRVCYWDLACALSLVTADRFTLTAIIKEIYEPVAAMRNVEWHCVEVSMRKAVVYIWQRGDRELLQKIMHRTLPEPPTVGEFLGAFALYLEYEEEEAEREFATV